MRSTVPVGGGRSPLALGGVRASRCFRSEVTARAGSDAAWRADGFVFECGQFAPDQCAAACARPSAAGVGGSL